MAGIYVHIPFCHSKCAYCDFYSVATTARMEEFVSHLIAEYTVRRNENGAEQVETLYFGGGTPSILPQAQFSKLAEPFAGLTSLKEFTIEVNPEDVSLDKVKFWHDHGVNRISIGVQSLVDTELKAVRRRHSASEALRAIETIRSGGIDNVSADLIYGLPDQTLDSWRYSLETLLGQGITHLSAYTLSYEPGTLLWKQLLRGQVRQCDEEVLYDMYSHLCAETSARGFEHYEISNFGLPGRHSFHNSSYWSGVPYLGLGPGAHSLDSHGVRRYNSSDLRAYLSVEPGAAAIIDEETDLDRANDTIITALRTARGLAPEQLPEPYRSQFLQTAAPHLRTGHLTFREGHYTIPEPLLLTSDTILRNLLLE